MSIKNRLHLKEGLQDKKKAPIFNYIKTKHDIRNGIWTSV